MSDTALVNVIWSFGISDLLICLLSTGNLTASLPFLVELLKSFSPFGTLGINAVSQPATTVPGRDVDHPLDLSSTTQPSKPAAAPQTEKKSRFLSKKAVAILQNWYQKHRDHPYATDDEVRQLALAGGITHNQVCTPINDFPFQMIISDYHCLDLLSTTTQNIHLSWLTEWLTGRQCISMYWYTVLSLGTVN